MRLGVSLLGGALLVAGAAMAKVTMLAATTYSRQGCAPDNAVGFTFTFFNGSDTANCRSFAEISLTGLNITFLGGASGPATEGLCGTLNKSTPGARFQWQCIQSDGSAVGVAGYLAAFRTGVAGKQVSVSNIYSQRGCLPATLVIQGAQVLDRCLSLDAPGADLQGSKFLSIRYFPTETRGYTAASDCTGAYTLITVPKDIPVPDIDVCGSIGPDSGPFQSAFSTITDFNLLLNGGVGPANGGVAPANGGGSTPPAPGNTGGSTPPPTTGGPAGTPSAGTQSPGSGTTTMAANAGSVLTFAALGAFALSAIL